MASVSILMAACNQGDWVRKTIVQVRDGIAPLDHDVIVVDDQSLDGCCHGLPRDVLILRPHDRMGVSGARRFAAQHARGDVLIYTDPHCEYPPGALADLAKAAAKIPGIHQPATRATSTSPICLGGVLSVCDRGLRIRGCFSRPSEHPALINSIYAMSRDTHDQLDGWPHLPGVWGCSEQALSLLAWFAKVPIHVHQEHTCIHHHYHEKGRFSYHVTRDDQSSNVFCVHYGFFPLTYDQYWRPMLEERWPGYIATIKSNAFRSLRRHAAKLAKRSEEEFFREVLKMVMPGDVLQMPVAGIADEEFVAQQRKRSHPILYDQARERISAVLNWMAESVPGCLKGRCAIDLGTRDGFGIEEMRRLGVREAVGVEIVPETAEEASRRLGGAVRSGDMRQLSEPDGRWDLVTCIHTLEHVPDPERALAEMVRITKPGGWLLVVVPREETPIQKHAHNCAFPTIERLRDFLLSDQRLDASTVRLDTAIFWPPDQQEFRVLVKRHHDRKSRNRQLQTNGVIYQLTTASYADVLTVSLWTLRRHYRGPVTIFASEAAREIAEVIGADKRLMLNIESLEMPAGPCYRADWTAKVFAYLSTPYDRTIWLDADTIVLQPIDALFKPGFHVSQLSNFRLNDPEGYPVHMREYMSCWENPGPIVSRMMAKALELNVPVVNAGILGYVRDEPAMYELHHLALLHKSKRQADEVALQILLPRIANLNVVSEEWNWSPRYGANLERARVIHFHGKQWYRRDTGIELFAPHLQAAIEANAGGLAGWAGMYNENVKPLIGAASAAKASPARSIDHAQDGRKTMGRNSVHRQLRDALKWAAVPIGSETSVSYLGPREGMSEVGGRLIKSEREDPSNLGRADSALDVVVSYRQLDGLEHPEILIAEMARVLRPGGYLIVVETKAGEHFQDARSLLRTIRGLSLFEVRSARALAFKYRESDSVIFALVRKAEVKARSRARSPQAAPAA